MRWFLILLAALVATPAGAQAPTPGDLVINEIAYDPPTPQPSTNEWVEVLNVASEPRDIGGLVVSDGGTPSAAVPAGTVLPAGGFAVLVRNGAAFAAAYPGVAFVELAGFPTLNNSGDRLAVVLGGVEIDVVPYLASWGGTDASLERRDPRGPSSSASNFATTTDPSGGTPGAENSQFAPDQTGPTLTAARVRADGRAVLVTVDEPLDPASVTPAAFAIASGPPIASASYAPGATTVLLGFAPGQALSPGTVTVTATGLRDLTGNATASTSVTTTLARDETPPVIARAAAPSATVVRVTFSEPVTLGTGAAASTYVVTSEAGPAPVASVRVVTFDAASGETGLPGVLAVDVALAEPLRERAIYTVTARALADLAGNVTEATSARLFFGTADTPGRGQIVITEILYDPVNGSAGEYLEVLNTSADGLFDLRAVTLSDGTGGGVALAREPVVLLPGEYLALVRTAAGFRATFPDAPFVVSGTVISLSNSGETLVLRAGAVTLDSVAYTPRWHRVELDDATGISLERRDPAGDANTASNWSSSLAQLGGTPSAPNSLSISGTPAERQTSLTITSPFAPTRGEAAQITYTLSTEAGLVRARIYDGGGRLVRQLEPGRLSGQTATLVWDGTGDDRRPQRAGIYVVLVEAVDVQGGTTDALRGVVVLARPEE